MCRLSFPYPWSPPMLPRQVWKNADHTPWPEGLQGLLARRLSAAAIRRAGLLRLPGKCLVLNWQLLKNRNDRDEPFFTLLHEFAHPCHPRLRYGKEFRLILATVYGRLLGDDRPEQMLALRLNLRRLKAEDRTKYRSLYDRIRELL